MADQAQCISAPPPPVPLANPVAPQATQQPVSMQAPQQPVALQVPQQPAAPQTLQQMLHLNWSNLKPEFSGKPHEDAEAQVLHTSDWMNTHHFVEGVQVQRFCLILLGKARLWYHS